MCMCMRMFVCQVDGLYNKFKVTNSGKQGWNLSLGEFVDRLATMPLVFEPGTKWLYGYNTDVVGRLVEVLSGQSLEEYFSEHIFKPLKMLDTSFFLSEDKADRLASCTMRLGQTGAMLATGQSAGDRGLRDISAKVGDATSRFKRRDPAFFSGGGGLLSTTNDYYRFCQMLLNGGVLEGARVIGRKTLQWMTRNHLFDESRTPCDMEALGLPGYSQSSKKGMGFGLGFGVVLNASANEQIATEGAYLWGGLASTFFWVDPSEDLLVVFMTQLLLRDDRVLPLPQLCKQRVYACLSDSPKPGPTPAVSRL